MENNDNVKSDLIDLVSPTKLNVTYPLKEPLIPSPCNSSRRESINSACSFVIMDTMESPENNPFDQVLHRVVDFEQRKDDPFERALEASFRFVNDENVGSGEVESISNIKMDFDMLPDSDDEVFYEPEYNLIGLSEVGLQKERSLEKQVTELVAEPTPLQKSSDTVDEEVEIAKLLEPKKMLDAVSALLSLQELISNTNNIQAQKYLDGLQKTLGVNLDSNAYILSNIQIVMDGDNKNDDVVKESEKEPKTPKVVKKQDLNEVNNKSSTKKKTPKTVLTSLKSVISKKAKDTVVNMSKNALNAASELKVESKDRRKSLLKVENKGMLKSPIGQLRDSLKKSPCLKYSLKPPETSYLRRSNSMSQSSKTNETFLVTSDNTKTSLSGSSEKNKTTMQPQKELIKPRPRLGTYTISKPNAGSSSTASSSSDNTKAGRVSRLPSPSKFRPRRTSTMLTGRPGSFRTTDDKKMEQSKTLHKGPVKSEPERQNNNPKPAMPRASTINAKVFAKAVPDKKLENRPALSPLENQSKAVNTKGSVATSVQRRRASPNKINQDKENRVN